MSQISNGKQGIFVVVWECQNYQGRWRPYSPEVTQHLERAYSKNLRSVKLGDVNPDLNGLTIIISDMKQICNDREDSNDKNVRRHFYPHSSPAGQGSVWQWSGEKPGDWFTYDMCVQIALEDAWTTGTQKVDLNDHFPGCPYTVDFCNLFQINKNSGYTRRVRRANQAGYPITRPNTPLQSNNYSGHNSSNSNGHSHRSSKVAMENSVITENDQFKRLSSKEDIETKSKNEGGARSLLNKVGGLLHIGGNSNDGSSTSKTLTNHSKTSTNRNKVSSANHSKSSSTNHSKASSTNHSKASSTNHSKASCANHSKASYTNHSKGSSISKAHISAMNSDNFTNKFNSNRNVNNTLPSEQNSSNLLVDQRRGKKPPIPKPRTMFPIQNDQMSYQTIPQQFHERMDSGEELFGSCATLNSDSSTMSPRRPSIETISTYLSQESFNEEYEAQSLPLPSYNQAAASRVDNLIQLDDSMEDDDVFAVDQEVRDVFMKQSSFSSSPNDDNSSLQRNSHFVPIIATPTNYTDNDAQPNGTKRKRVSDKFSHQATASPKDSPLNNNYFSNFKMRKPLNNSEKLLVAHTQKVLHPPNSDCSICMCSVSEPLDLDANTGFLVSPVVATSKCKHIFHELCLVQLLAHVTTETIFLKCPNCNTIHGEKWGNRPKGTMDVRIIHDQLPGFSNCRTIEITYQIPPGIQGSEHPNPGQPYHPVGFPRVAFLPDNDTGRRVLRLLTIAFNRRLTFTVGMSVTSGRADCVTWNEIHHKTQWNNGSGHGYPDPNYLINVLEELKAHGIVD